MYSLYSRTKDTILLGKCIDLDSEKLGNVPEPCVEIKHEKDAYQVACLYYT